MEQDKETPTETRERIVGAYVEALNTLSTDTIVFLIHPEFYFKWDDNVGIWTDLRYLGHLTKMFACMKREGKTINAEVIYRQAGSYTFPCIKLSSPVHLMLFYTRRIFNSSDYPTLTHDVVLYPRIKHGKLFRVYCYANEMSLTNNFPWIEIKESPRGY